MPSEKPLIMCYLLNCLDFATYPDLLRWEDKKNGEFRVNLKRRNSRGWTKCFAEHYKGWDQLNFDSGLAVREPQDSNQYYTDSRKRFKTALEKHEQLECLQEMDDEGNIIYRILDFGATAEILSSPQSETTNPSLDQGYQLSMPETGLELRFVIALNLERPNEIKRLSFYIDSWGEKWVSDDQQIAYQVNIDENEIFNNVLQGVPLANMAALAGRFTAQEIPVEVANRHGEHHLDENSNQCNLDSPSTMESELFYHADCMSKPADKQELDVSSNVESYYVHLVSDPAVTTTSPTSNCSDPMDTLEYYNMVDLLNISD